MAVASGHAWRASHRTLIHVRRLSSLPFQSQGGERCWHVSSYGRVRNTSGVISHGTFLPTGYRAVQISGKHLFVHRVVAFTFLGHASDPAAWQVHHKDGNPSNNRLDNLEYATPRQNVLHSYASLSRRCGGVHHSIPVMWRAFGSQSWSTAASMKEAAEQLGMGRSSISRGCRQGKLVKGYEFHLVDSAENSTVDWEVWRQMYDPMSGHELPGRMVSSLGRIQSQNGNRSWGCLLKSGYFTTGITCCSRLRKELVHRLVAYTFLGPPPAPERCFINHKDLDKGNNAVENLEYVTPSENNAHRLSNSSALRRGDAKAIESRPCCSNGEWSWHRSITSAAQTLRVNPGNISKCIAGRSKHTEGLEFRLARVDGDEVRVGEEWRKVNVEALLQEGALRRQKFRGLPAVPLPQH